VERRCSSSRSFFLTVRSTVGVAMASSATKLTPRAMGAPSSSDFATAAVTAAATATSRRPASGIGSGPFPRPLPLRRPSSRAGEEARREQCRRHTHLIATRRIPQDPSSRHQVESVSQPLATRCSRIPPIDHTGARRTLSPFLPPPRRSCTCSHGPIRPPFFLSHRAGGASGTRPKHSTKR